MTRPQYSFESKPGIQEMAEKPEPLAAANIGEKDLLFSLNYCKSPQMSTIYDESQRLQESARVRLITMTSSVRPGTTVPGQVAPMVTYD